jgi:hypothetical protein
MIDIPGNLFPRRLDRPLTVAQKAHGIWITDENGKQYMDASGGAIVVNAGHGREQIAKAVYDQILSQDYIHPTMFTIQPAEMLANFLAKKAPGDIDRFYFLSGGSEANEAAIKLARQIHLANGMGSKFRLISRWKSYHGLTLGSLSAMGRTTFKAPFAPLLNECMHIPAPYCYRCSFNLEYPACGLRCAHALDEIIEDAGAETVSAFIAETILGATIAAAIPPEEYLPIIRQICEHHQVLLILDEVMCGMGRTGRWFACNHYRVTPDILTLGKGLAGGVLALSALGVREQHFNTIRQTRAGFVHGGTFSHHPVASAAGLALVWIMEEESLVEQAGAKGERLGELLKKALLPLAQVGDVRGRGMMWGIEIVEHGATKQPFKRNDCVTERLWELLFSRGFIVYKATSLAGSHGDAIVLAPPFTITDDELVLLVTAVKKAFLDFF